MKKVLISLAVVMLVGTGIEVKAMKGLRKPVAPVVGEAGGEVNQKTGPIPVQLLFPVAKQVNMTDAEKIKIKAEVKKGHEMIVQMALQRGNLTDALTFIDESGKFIKAYGDELGKAAESSLAEKLPAPIVPPRLTDLPVTK